MKVSKFWLFFIAYIGIFIIGGVLVYFRYLNKFFSTSAEPATVYTIGTKGNIYYAQDNDLFRLNPSLDRDLNAVSFDARLQSTGQVVSLDISKNNSTAVYAAKNSLGYLEIWKVNLETRQSGKIATRGQDNLDEYLDFLNPKFNQQGTKFAFIAQKSGINAIFIADQNNAFSELLIPAQVEIADFAWSKEGDTIIYCTENQSENACFAQALGSNSAQKVITQEVLKIDSKEDKFIYLAKKDQTSNIYSYDPKNGKSSAITDLIAPKTVTYFSLNDQALKMAYEVKDGNLKEIISSDTDGNQRLVIASGENISQPIISPDGKQIAFLKNNDGIYVIDVTNYNERKIVNLKNYLLILAWR